MLRPLRSPDNDVGAAAAQRGGEDNRGDRGDRDGGAAGAAVALSPLRLAALLLRSVRLAAQSALETAERSAPGFSPQGRAGKAEIHNVVLGVPAYFSLSRRRAVLEAARLAGFGGYVGLVTESTAAAVSYGLFVSPDRRRTSGGEKEGAGGAEDAEVGADGGTRRDEERSGGNGGDDDDDDGSRAEGGTEAGEEEEEAKEEGGGEEGGESGAADGGGHSEDEEGWTAMSAPSSSSSSDAISSDGGSDDAGDAAAEDDKEAAASKNKASGAGTDEDAPACIPAPAADRAATSAAEPAFVPATRPSGKAILVFDMGGGTTDVTVASMGSSSSGSGAGSGPGGAADGATDADGNEEEDVRFRVLATAGDDRLGGDDLDEALARRVWETKLGRLCGAEDATGGGGGGAIPASVHRRLRSLCRAAKETLCGNVLTEEGEVIPPEPRAEFDFEGTKAEVAKEEFEAAIAPLVERAEGVVREALRTYAARVGVEGDGSDGDGGGGGGDGPPPLPIMDEVVLVGGSTRSPSIWSMLSRLFPPRNPPELCTSVNPEEAVGHGCAIRSAALSGKVPKWELRNALMLDALPHGLGVLVAAAGGPAAAEGEEGNGRYVPILRKDTPLPAMGGAVFQLADPLQPGITVVAAEDVRGHRDGPGPHAASTSAKAAAAAEDEEGEGPQVVGTFTFLLHRPTPSQLHALRERGRAREVRVGMTVHTDGKFVVSVFDELDPEHEERRRRWLARKKRDGEAGGKDGGRGNVLGYDEEDEEKVGGEAPSSPEELFLMVACVVAVVFYVAARVAFSISPDDDSGSRIL